MTTGRFRAAVVTGALLVTGLPLVAGAVAPHLTCGVKQTGTWETIPVRSFQPVSGLAAPDVVTAYGLDTREPHHVVATNGVRLQLSETHGCDWRNGYALDPGITTNQPFAGSTSTIVSVGTSHDIVLAAVQEGSGSASRPHVLRYASGAWGTFDEGLPPQGSPRLLRMASDGRTAYLTVSPNATGGTDSSGPTPLPTLPPLPVPLPGAGSGGGPSDGSTALLYGSTDGGLTWSLRTDPAAVPAGGQGFTDLVVDPDNANWVYGVAGGQFLISRDGGAHFTTAPGAGYTTVTPYNGFVLAFTADGRGTLTANGEDFVPVRGPRGITSVAARGGDSSVVVESDGALKLLNPYTGDVRAIPAKRPARPGSLLGDTGAQSSFHALSGHDLLRYVDPVPPSQRIPPIAVGDRSVPPPAVGTVTPSTHEVRLLVGQKATADFTLDLPKNPTPLDLFFLVDVSGSMSTYIDDLKRNINKVVTRLERERIDLKVGVGTLGTGPAEGESPYPESYAYPPATDPATGQAGPAPAYRKPRIYERIRAIGDTGPRLRQAINSIRLETPPPRSPGDVGTFHEGQLLALEQMVTGSGLQTEQEDRAGLSTYSAVTPGQDAGWRENPGVRRIVVVASDEAFDVPYGTPQEPGSTTDQPLIDYRRTLSILNKARVGVFGITAGSPDSVPDMITMARGTRTFTPPGGVSCGGDPEQELPGGAPLVCSQEGDFSTIIAQVLASLTDVQDLQLQPSIATPVLTGVRGQGLLGLDVKKRNRAGFQLDLTCVDISPGSYDFEVDALLRKYPVGRTQVRVTCVEPVLAAVPPVLPPPVVRPPVLPVIQPPPPPPPPPPAAQPQPQPQPNVNPLTAGVTQEQQEAQLALALNDERQEEQEQEEPSLVQMAMVDRRQRQEVQAYGSLLLAMVVCSGLGLARLRSQRQVAVRRAR